MEFVVENVVKKARVGCINGQGERKHISMPTPNCTLYTRIGSAPHLTRDMLLKLQNLPRLVQYSLTNWVAHVDALKAYENGINAFTAMEGFLSYVAVQDTSRALPNGYNDKLGTSVWSVSGRTKLDPDSFHSTQEALKPDMYQVLCDSDVHLETSRKRARKSVDRNIDFMAKNIPLHEKSERLKNVSMVGTMGGGSFEDLRLNLASEISSHPLTGSSIEGFHSFGPDTEKLAYETIQEILEKQLEKLPTGQFRLLPGVYSPLLILQAVEAGVDLFESVYPYIVTERGNALTFNYNLPAKVTKVLEEVIPEAEPAHKDCGMEINLKEKQYVDDFGPLLEGCSCYTCTTFSRAYVNHLLNTKELLAGTLLMMHNFHHYFGFFSAIRQALHKDQLEDLKNLIQKQENQS